MNRPSAKASTIARTMSSMLTAITFSKKLDLKTSEKLMITSLISSLISFVFDC
jgi:hypothetical protein